MFKFKGILFLCVFILIFSTFSFLFNSNISAHRYGRYSIYLSCIEIKDNGTYIAYFGYNNSRNRNQRLRKSVIENAQGDAPKILLKGGHPKAFSVIVETSKEVIWKVRGGGKRQIAKANANSVQCSNGEEHIPVSYPEAEDDPEYTDDEEITDEQENQELPVENNEQVGGALPNVGTPVTAPVQELQQSLQCQASHYLLPYPGGSSYNVNQGNHNGYSHSDEYNQYAWDFNLQFEPVVATRDGKVHAAFDENQDSVNNESSLCDNFVNYMVLDNADGTSSIYLHLKQMSIPEVLLNEGTQVRKGDIIGYSGNSGCTSGVNGAHLHYTLQSLPPKGYHYAYGLPSTFADVSVCTASDQGIPKQGVVYKSDNYSNSPSLISPVGAIKLNDPSITNNYSALTFKWNPFTKPNRTISNYRIWIYEEGSNRPEPGQPGYIYKDYYDSNTTQTTLNILNNIPGNKNIIWEINAYYKDGSEPFQWTLPNAGRRTFALQIDPPTMQSPQTNIVEPDRNFRVKLQKSLSRGTNTQYQIQIAKDSSFSSIVSDSNWTNSTDSFATVKAGGKYYIRAKQKDSKDETDWSTPVQFTVSHSQVTPTEFTTSGGEKRLYQTVRGVEDNWDRFYQRYTTDGIFDSSSASESWTLQPGNIISDVTLIQYNGYLVQSALGKNDKIYIRESADGDNWTSWFQTTNASLPINKVIGDIEMFVSENLLFQTVHDANNKAYLRSTTDRVFNESDMSERFNIYTGSPEGNITTVIFNNFNYQFTTDINNKTFFRTNQGGSWIDWTSISTPENNGGDLEVVVFRNKMYQIFRNENLTGKIYMRSSADGNFDNSSPSEIWMQQQGNTYSDITQVVFNNKLYQYSRDKNSGKIWTRISGDGDFDNKDVAELSAEQVEDIRQESWELYSGSTKVDPTFGIFNNKMYLTVVDPNGKVYMQESSDGNFAYSGGWIAQNGEYSSSLSPVTMSSNNVILYQTVVNSALSGNNIFSRSFDGSNWSSWTSAGRASQTAIVRSTTLNNVVFQTARASDKKIYIRFSKNDGSFSFWQYTGGMSVVDSDITVFNNKVYLSAFSTDGRLFLNSTDGSKDSNDNLVLSGWKVITKPSGGATSYPVSLKEFSSRLYFGFSNSVDNNAYLSSIDSSEVQSDGVYPVLAWEKNGGSNRQINFEVFSNKLFETVVTSTGDIWYRSFDSSSWSNWQKAGAAGGDSKGISSVVFNSKMYQGVKGKNQNIFVRSTGDDTFDNLINSAAVSAAPLESWHEPALNDQWAKQSGTVTSDVPMLNVNNKLFQFARGGSSNKLYFRVSADGNFDSSDEQWILADGSYGSVNSPIDILNLNGKIIVTFYGSGNSIYSRVLNADDKTWIGDWTSAGVGISGGRTHSVNFNGKIIQSVRNSSRNVFIRTSNDGQNWSLWTNSSGMSNVDSTFAVFNNKLYQSAFAGDKKLYLRTSDDGASWSGWTGKGNVSLGGEIQNIDTEISMIDFKSKLHLFSNTNGAESRGVYSAMDTDGNISEWVTPGGAKSVADQIVFNGTLFQSVITTSRDVWYRYSSDGTSWSSFMNAGKANSGAKQVNSEVFLNRLFQSAYGPNSKLFLRSSGSGLFLSGVGI